MEDGTTARISWNGGVSRSRSGGRGQWQEPGNLPPSPAHERSDARHPTEKLELKPQRQAEVIYLLGYDHAQSRTHEKRRLDQ